MSKLTFSIVSTIAILKIISTQFHLSLDIVGNKFWIFFFALAGRLGLRRRFWPSKAKSYHISKTINNI